MRETTSPTEGNELFDLDSDSRRSFLKKGALASSVLALGVSGTAAAQETDGGVGDLDDNWKALTFIDNFHPNARFTFVSGVVEWAPNYGDVQDSYFSDYNTYMIRWLNTDNVVPLFVAQGANIGEYDADLGFIPDDDDDQNQPQLFEMNREWTPFGDNERLITVNASPVGEETEDEILANDDWWQGTQDSGTTPAGNGS
ncbi:hypothetical protein [Haloarcula nitratireducens]|uniref:Uncharacterized protein n=1 Tax=Haloarcula nitratireducens TaxID=2487749 RepID=A0AAW4PFP7_9EURY|nr:hypothetical protein [Halomicroarcula nitratireducens]MBX0296820.1 hypothetical protein [Halomicroarcula nitratireducens]